MKKIDKKDLPKLIVLVVLSIGVFGFAAMQFLATPTTKAASATAPAAGEAQPASPAGEQPADSAAATDDTYRVEDIAILTSGKDPFIPNGPAAKNDPLFGAAPPKPDPIKVASTPRPAVTPRITELTPLPSGAGAPPYFEGPERASGPTAESVAPVVLPPPPPPAYVVTGIVRGEESVAILRGGSGEEERLFVRVGDPVGNGFKVTAVRADGVEIRSGDRRAILKLGGDSRAK